MMAEQTILRGRITYRRPRFEQQKTEDGRGIRAVEVGTTIADLYVTVDLAALARAIGKKAMVNKNRRSILQSGAIIIEAKNVRHE